MPNEAQPISTRRQSHVDEIISETPILPYDEAVALQHANLLGAVRRADRPVAEFGGDCVVGESTSPDGYRSSLASIRASTSRSPQPWRV